MVQGSYNRRNDSQKKKILVCCITCTWQVSIIMSVGMERKRDRSAYIKIKVLCFILETKFYIPYPCMVD